jgi:hypothetical protein
MLAYCNKLDGLAEDSVHELHRDMVSAFQDLVRANLEVFQLLIHYSHNHVPLQQFQEDGILLPLGHSREQYKIPNRVLFFEGGWHVRPMETLRSGWNFNEINNVGIGYTTNNIHGELYCYIKALVHKFRSRLIKLTGCIELHNTDAMVMADKPWTFDRIEVKRSHFLRKQ